MIFKLNYMDKKILEQKIKNKLNEIETKAGYAVLGYRTSIRDVKIIENLNEFAELYPLAVKIHTIGYGAFPNLKMSLQQSDKLASEICDASSKVRTKYISNAKIAEKLSFKVGEISSLFSKEEIIQTAKEASKRFRELKQNFLRMRDFYEGAELASKCEQLLAQKNVGELCDTDVLIKEATELKERITKGKNIMKIQESLIARYKISQEAENFVYGANKNLLNLMEQLEEKTEEARDSAKKIFSSFKESRIMTPGLLEKTRNSMKSELQKVSGIIDSLIQFGFEFDEINKQFKDENGTIKHSFNKFEQNRDFITKASAGKEKYKQSLANMIQEGENAARKLNIDSNKVTNAEKLDAENLESKIKDWEAQIQNSAQNYPEKVKAYLTQEENDSPNNDLQGGDEESVEKKKSAFGEAYQIGYVSIMIKKVQSEFEEAEKTIEIINERLRKEGAGIWAVKSNEAFGYGMGVLVVAGEAAAVAALMGPIGLACWPLALGAGIAGVLCLLTSGIFALIDRSLKKDNKLKPTTT